MKKYIIPLIGFMLGMFLFWVSGNEFARGEKLAWAILSSFGWAAFAYGIFVYGEK